MTKLLEINLPQDRIARLKRKMAINDELFVKFDEKIRLTMGLSKNQYDHLGYETQDEIVRMIRFMIAEYHIENNTEFAEYYLHKDAC